MYVTRGLLGGNSCPHPGCALALGWGSMCLPPPVLPAFPVRPGQLESPDLALVRSSVACILSAFCPISPFHSALLTSVLCPLLTNPGGCRCSLLAALSLSLPHPEYSSDVSPLRCYPLKQLLSLVTLPHGPQCLTWPVFLGGWHATHTCAGYTVHTWRSHRL